MHRWAFGFPKCLIFFLLGGGGWLFVVISWGKFFFFKNRHGTLCQVTPLKYNIAKMNVLWLHFGGCLYQEHRGVRGIPVHVKN